MKNITALSNLIFCYRFVIVLPYLNYIFSLKSSDREKIDYIIDFIGRPEKDVDLFKKVNNLPAQVMLRVAEKHRVKAMGFIGGVLGPKSFVNGKKLIIESLEKSDIPLAVVEPTIVYGNGRADTLAKMVPILKVVGVLVKMLKPVHVDDVANELITQLIKRS